MEYMSQEGYDKIVAELHELETVELPRVKDAISEARDKGDLSIMPRNESKANCSEGFASCNACWSLPE